MTYSEFKEVVCGDVYRESGDASSKEFRRRFFCDAAFRCVFFYRLGKLMKASGGCMRFFSKWLSFIRKRQTIKYGVRIPLETEVGTGLYVGHTGGIWISREVIIGKNCNISHNVTLGAISKGAGKGAPTIGDQVYIGPGAVISGKVTIGDNALIGANSVVLTDVPENGVFIGVPAKLFSKAGSEHYMSHLVQDLSQ
ncbi:MAG: serine acetyltransferase [Verrucomicrobiales bacterium]|nr:serine acetyltransferase [Verrucomicrobiales bacterium]